MKLETPRLILRPHRHSDWKDIAEGAGDIAVSCRTAVIPHPYSKKDALFWINTNIKNWGKKEKTTLTWLIELKAEKKVIGATGIHDIKTLDGVCKTGSWINKNYWRKGYILEAKIAVLDYIFDTLKMRKVETSAFATNTASQGMSKKLGFKEEGHKRKSTVCMATGKIHDEILFGLLKSEWKKKKPVLVKAMRKKYYGN